jgi:hypothetical protein
LLECLLADDGLVHQHVVQHAAKGVPGVWIAAGHFYCLADGDPEAARRVRVFSQHGAASIGEIRWTRVHGGAVRLHQHLAVRLLVVGGANHPYLALKTE